MATLTIWGAAREVTGSCYLVQQDGHRFLVDCGLHQGGPDESALNIAPFPFDPTTLDFVLLTHAHIDHSGLLPRLVDKGFRGPVIATAATADLCAVMLRDSGRIQESEAEWRSRKGRRAGRPAWEPAYTEQDALRAIAKFQGYDYDEDIQPAEGVSVRFRDAGHILGSAIVEVGLSQKGFRPVRLVFSGDMGQPDQPIIRDPDTGLSPDYLVMESTYGDRRHEPQEDAVVELAAILREARDTGGNVIIPSFAVGRTQELIYFLRSICEKEKLQTPIYVDSPLAKEATEAYRRHPEVFDDEARALINDGLSLFQFSQLHYTSSPEESRELNGKSGIVIISSSGMAEAGRIKHHLKHNLWRPEAHVVIVGYQAAGTLGRRILEGAPRVRIFGEEIVVRAKIHEITGLSAHADCEQLIQWARTLMSPRLALLTHGEPQAAFALQKALQERLGWQVAVPTKGQTFDLKPMAAG